jgi:Leu/Phe-tRNA-protein transferase
VFPSKKRRIFDIRGSFKPKRTQKLSKNVKIFPKPRGSAQNLSKFYKNGLFVFIDPGHGEATWFRLKKQSQFSKGQNNINSSFERNYENKTFLEGEKTKPIAGLRPEIRSTKP